MGRATYKGNGTKSKMCPHRDSNTGGSDLWSNTQPLNHAGAPAIILKSSGQVNFIIIATKYLTIINILCIEWMIRFSMWTKWPIYDRHICHLLKTVIGMVWFNLPTYYVIRHHWSRRFYCSSQRYGVWFRGKGTIKPSVCSTLLFTITIPIRISFFPNKIQIIWWYNPSNSVLTDNPNIFDVHKASNVFPKISFLLLSLFRFRILVLVPVIWISSRIMYLVNNLSLEVLSVVSSTFFTSMTYFFMNPVFL